MTTLTSSKGACALDRQKPDSERRAWVRLPLAIPVFVRSRDQNGKDFLEFATAVNISAGGDFEESYLTNSLSQTVERCTQAGLTVICAVGNAGHVPGHPVLPPASDI